MNKIFREQALARRFYDDDLFARGFSRSGDFSLAESELLLHYGHLCQAIERNILLNPTHEDRQLALEINGHVKPKSQLAKVWLKYRQLRQKKAIHMVESAKGSMPSAVPMYSKLAAQRSELDPGLWN